MTGLIISLLVILTFIQISSQKNILESELQTRIDLMKRNLNERGKAFSDNLALQVENAIASFNLLSIINQTDQAVKEHEELSYIILMDSKGEAHIHTLNPELQGTRLTAKEDKFAMGQKTAVINEYVKNGKGFMEFIVPIQLGAELWGGLRIGYSLEELNRVIVTAKGKIEKETGEMVIRSIFTCIGFVIISSVIILILSTRLSRPLIRLTQSAQELAHGNFSAAEKITVKSDDEVGILAQTFKNMSKDLRTSYEKLEDYSRTLEQKVEKRTKELAEARDQAVSASESKSQFLANMSHEIRTPLNAIIGFSELLSSLVVEKKQRSYLESVQTAGKSLLTLINDILDLSKMEAGRMEIHYEAVNPHMLFHEIKQVFEIKILEKGLDFLMEIDPDLPQSLLLDETRLRQVLFNLVGNAVKFTSKGHVKLSACKIFTDEEASKLDLTISVEDTGIGVPEEHRESIFDSFKQQDSHITKKYGGTGLGLSITKRLVELMNGQIVVKGVDKMGSIFEVVLRNIPVASTQALALKEDQPFDIGRVSFEKGRVMVVDDVASNRNLVRAALSKTGLEVVEAEDGQKALLLAKEHKPDLILMDIRMPVMDGYEATKELKGILKTQDIPVIALTASSKVGNPAKLKESGFDGFLAKPVTMRHLFKEMSRFLTSVEKPVPILEHNVDDTPQESLAPEELKRLPDLIRTLREEFMPQWEESKGAMEMEAVEGFSERLLKLGEEYKVPGLIRYAGELLEFTRDFDVEQMETALKEFPGIVKKIEGEE